MMQRYRFLVAVALPLVLLDQGTKFLIAKTLEYHETITVVANFFDIVHARNKGAAFGIMRDSAIRLPFLIGVSLVAVIAVLLFYRKLENGQRLSAWGLALVLAGAMGNLIDRVRFGEVVDFLSVHWYEHFWPAFNVADSAICIGVALLALEMILEERRKKADGSSTSQ